VLAFVYPCPKNKGKNVAVKAVEINDHLQLNLTVVILPTEESSLNSIGQEMLQQNKAKRLAKIKWQCRRGMLELDLLLQSFIEKEQQQLTAVDLDQLEEVLSIPDPLLYQWLMEEEATDEIFKPLIQRIRMSY
jgi:antitoxin CptB